jgi:cytochrome c oxidase assembly protein subunit 11
VSGETANKPLALRLGIAAVAMFGFGFALVPLYDIFCEITGIRIPIKAQDAASIVEATEPGRAITLEFLASTNGSAPWEFEPASDTLTVRTGKLNETTYFARNLTDRQLVGVATPDIRPAEAGRYFRKVECFCFNEQEFAAGEARELGVRFFVEPDLPAHIDTITLSYTMFAQQEKLASIQSTAR